MPAGSQSGGAGRQRQPRRVVRALPCAAPLPPAAALRLRRGGLPRQRRVNAGRARRGVRRREQLTPPTPACRAPPRSEGVCGRRGPGVSFQPCAFQPHAAGDDSDGPGASLPCAAPLPPRGSPPTPKGRSAAPETCQCWARTAWRAAAGATDTACSRMPRPPPAAKASGTLPNPACRGPLVGVCNCVCSWKGSWYTLCVFLHMYSCIYWRGGGKEVCLHFSICDRVRVFTFLLVIVFKP